MERHNTAALTYTRPDLARALGISPASIDRRVADGSLPLPRRLGGRAVWLRSEVEAALANLPAGLASERAAAARAARHDRQPVA